MIILLNITSYLMVWALLVIYNPKKEWDEETKASKAKLFKIILFLLIIAFFIFRYFSAMEFIQTIKDLVNEIEDIINGDLIA